MVWDPLHNAYEITRINVPHTLRGRGYGTQILKAILADADTEGATLRLGPSPSDGLSFDDLVHWYERHGFHFPAEPTSLDNYYGMLMERSPQTEDQPHIQENTDGT